jgi:hypothetical protein
MSLFNIYVIIRFLVSQNIMIKFPLIGTGRGNNTHAYTHSVGESHHVFLNLHTLRFYCLPDNYEIIGKCILLYSNIICSFTFDKVVRIVSCTYDKCKDSLVFCTCLEYDFILQEHIREDILEQTFVEWIFVWKACTKVKMKKVS